MAFLVGSKGIGTPTWGHSLKVDPYLWSSKLSFLYDIDYLRNIESLYGNEVLKQYILEKLKAIDKFDDCLVITDFTQFTETGTVEDLVGGGDSVSWEKTTDELKCTITTDATEGDRHAWMYVNFASNNITKIYFSYVCIISSASLEFDICNASGETLFNPPDCYWIRAFTTYPYYNIRLLKNVGGTETTLAAETTEVTPTKVAGFIDVSNNIQKVWANSDPIDLSNPLISVSDSEITAIASFRFRAHTTSTSATQTYEWKVPLIVAWKS